MFAAAPLSGALRLAQRRSTQYECDMAASGKRAIRCGAPTCASRTPRRTCVVPATRGRPVWARSLVLAAALLALTAAGCGGGSPEAVTVTQTVAEATTASDDPAAVDFSDLSPIEQTAIELAEYEFGGSWTRIGFLGSLKDDEDYEDYCGGGSVCNEYEVTLDNGKQATCTVYGSGRNWDGYCIRS